MGKRQVRSSNSIVKCQVSSLSAPVSQSSSGLGLSQICHAVHKHKTWITGWNKWPKENFYCDECSSAFTTKTALKTHKNKDHDLIMFEECKLTFEQEDEHKSKEQIEAKNCAKNKGSVMDRLYCTFPKRGWVPSGRCGRRFRVALIRRQSESYL